VAVEGLTRPAWAEIDLDALRFNAASIKARLGTAALCAVVKADAYGHGAISAAEAFLGGGADGLAVAIVDEGVELRQAEITAPILLLSEPPVDVMSAAIAAVLTPTLTTLEGVEAAEEAAKRIGGKIPVHVKVDTGMHRMGVDPDELVGLLKAIQAVPQLSIEGLWTHLAVADESSEESRAFTTLQLERFEEAVRVAHAMGIDPPVLHVANSAGTIAVPGAMRSMVRCGLALYGELPTESVAQAAGPLGLKPAMTIKAEVTATRRLEAGARPSYGRLRALPHDGTVVTVPIGYADGFPRALFTGGQEVLIRGKRYPLAGSVTMDQIVVDVGHDEVGLGDEVVLLGSQGDERITVGEWATRLGVIPYEVLCGIGPRLPRKTVGVAHKVAAKPVKRRRWGWSSPTGGAGPDGDGS
jgi:alanine racemase